MRGRRIQVRHSSLSGLLAMTAILDVSSVGYCQDGGQGKYWYLNYCAFCHGTSGKGDGSIAKVLIQKPADLTALAAANGGTFPVSRVIETIDGRREVAAHGPRDMPVWGRSMRFAPTILRVRIRAIADYVATLQGK
jgi:mono/diheme cytochrome c family protein